MPKLDAQAILSLKMNRIKLIWRKPQWEEHESVHNIAKENVSQAKQALPWTTGGFCYWKKKENSSEA